MATREQTDMMQEAMMLAKAGKRVPASMLKGMTPEDRAVIEGVKKKPTAKKSAGKTKKK